MHWERRITTNLSMENIDLPNHGPRSSCARDSASNESDVSAGPLTFGSIDISDQNLDFSVAAHSPMGSSPRQSPVSANGIVNAYKNITICYHIVKVVFTIKESHYEPLGVLFTVGTRS